MILIGPWQKILKWSWGNDKYKKAWIILFFLCSSKIMPWFYYFRNVFLWSSSWCSTFTSGSAIKDHSQQAWENLWDLGIKPWTTSCKVNAVYAVLSLRHQLCLAFRNWYTEVLNDNIQRCLQCTVNETGEKWICLGWRHMI